MIGDESRSASGSFLRSDPKCVLGGLALRLGLLSTDLNGGKVMPPEGAIAGVFSSFGRYLGNRMPPWGPVEGEKTPPSGCPLLKICNGLGNDGVGGICPSDFEVLSACGLLANFELNPGVGGITGLASDSAVLMVRPSLLGLRRGGNLGMMKDGDAGADSDKTGIGCGRDTDDARLWASDGRVVSPNLPSFGATVFVSMPCVALMPFVLIIRFFMLRPRLSAALSKADVPGRVGEVSSRALGVSGLDPSMAGRNVHFCNLKGELRRSE